MCELTSLDLCDNPIQHCHCPLGLSALLVRSVFLLLLAAPGGQIRARLPAMTSSWLRGPTAAHRVTATIAGHLQALGTNRLPVPRIASTAGVWIGAVSLSAWPGYLGDDADLKAPRTESEKATRGWGSERNSSRSLS